MSTISNPERLAGNYADFVTELRELFALHGIHHGAPEDITALVERLTQPDDFPAELGSIIRSFIYRERGVIPRTELLEIVSVAIGGANIEQNAQEYHAQVRQLYGFLSTVSRSPAFRPQPQEVSQESVDGGSSQQPSSRDYQAATPVSPVQSPPPVAVQPQTVLPHSAFAALNAPLSSQSGQHRVAEPAGASPTTASADVRRPAAESPRALLRQHPLRWGWAVAILMPLLLIGWLLRDRFVPLIPTSSTPATAPVIESNAALGTAPKPSPLVLAQGGAPAPRTRVSSSSLPTASAPAATFPSTNAGRVAASTSPAPSQPAVPPTVTQQSVQQPALQQPDQQPSQQPDHQPDRQPQPAGVVSSSASRPPAVAAARIPARPRAGRQVGSYGVSSGVMAAYLISAPPPRYPKLARFTRTEGQVMLQAVVNRNGSVNVVHVLSGHHLLRGAAIDAVRRWRYRPYVINGSPVDVATIITVNFQLQ